MQMADRVSDDRIVPSIAGNAEGGKAVRPSRDSSLAPNTRSGELAVISRLNRITSRAEQHPEEAFNNLFTLITYDLLEMSFERLERNKAPGIDGQTMVDYEANLEPNLEDLLQRLHRQSYRPKPSLRRDIPKGNGKTRPLGIACVEDKIVQRAIVTILEKIYEVDFCDSSYGFRPGRSCHQALGYLGKIIATKKVNWISDADIKGFFDNVSHEHLLEFLKKRIADPRMLRLIQKFLDAGKRAKTAEHNEVFDPRSELGDGSHSGHRLGCSDYNKSRVRRFLMVRFLAASFVDCYSFVGSQIVHCHRHGRNASMAYRILRVLFAIAVVFASLPYSAVCSATRLWTCCFTDCPHKLLGFLVRSCVSTPSTTNRMVCVFVHRSVSSSHGPVVEADNRSRPKLGAGYHSRFSADASLFAS